LKNIFFSSISQRKSSLPEQKMALQILLPEEKVAFKYSYRTKVGSQKWLPEQKPVFVPLDDCWMTIVMFCYLVTENDAKYR
jgi:hypothetical protein